MFYKFSKLFMIFLMVTFCSVNLSSLYAFSDKDPVFNHIEIKKIDVPTGFINSTRYRLTYFFKDENGKFPVFPTLEDKNKDYDLILARAVREYFEDAYFSQNKAMDEHVVKDSDKHEIYYLVTRDYLSKAWDEDSFNSLRQFINHHGDSIRLFTMNVYLDYSAPSGKYIYGNDINPVILKFGKKSDEVIFIQVNYSDK